jgi:Trypsin-co-occurring domain 1
MEHGLEATARVAELDYTTFILPSGAVVSVESSRAPIPTLGSVTEATGAIDRAAIAWSDGINMVAEMAEQAVEQLRKATTFAKEVSVEFGVNISGKTGIILVEGTVAANLKVVLKW